MPTPTARPPLPTSRVWATGGGGYGRERRPVPDLGSQEGNEDGGVAVELVYEVDAAADGGVAVHPQVREALGQGRLL